MMVTEEEMHNATLVMFGNPPTNFHFEYRIVDYILSSNKPPIVTHKN